MVQHFLRSLGIAGLLVLSTSAAQAEPVGQGVTYQGQLAQGGSPTSGNFAMVFRLWDAQDGGTQVGPTLTFDGVGGNPAPVSVSGGLFNATLDFGTGAFNTGEARWLEITVEGVTLVPRQAFSASPFSIQTRGIVVNQAGDKVGIGTDAPTHPFHVSTTSPTTLLAESSSTIGTWLNVRNTSPGGRYWRLISTGSGNSEGAGNLLIGHGLDAGANSRVMTLLSNGDVGIGTFSPKQRLHVAGDYYGRGHVFLHAFEGDGQNGTAYLQARDDSGTSSIALNFRVQENGVLRTPLYLATNGNVGIGTANPLDALHVASGAIRFPDGSRQTTAARVVRSNNVIDFGSFGAGTAVGQAGVSGAVVGGSVAISPDQDLPNGLVIAWARVSAAGIVRFAVRNTTTNAIDPPPINFSISVINP